MSNHALSATTLALLLTACGGADDGELVSGQYEISSADTSSDSCALGLPNDAVGASIDLSWRDGVLVLEATSTAADDPGSFFAFELSRGEDDFDGRVTYINRETGTSSYGATGCEAESTQNRTVTIINEREFQFNGFVEFDPMATAPCSGQATCQTHYEARFIKM